MYLHPRKDHDVDEMEYTLEFTHSVSLTKKLFLGIELQLLETVLHCHVQIFKEKESGQQESLESASEKWRN
jgi:hypothetical protein